LGLWVGVVKKPQMKWGFLIFRELTGEDYFNSTFPPASSASSF
jgi:hypothetical protein